MRKYGLTPVEKAVARQKWSEATLKAHLQALIGGDWAKVVDSVATLTYIIGYAAHEDRIDRSDVDLRIIEGAARTALDVVVAESITDLQRGSLESGLLAIERLKPKLSELALMKASVNLTYLLKIAGGVYWRDFEHVFEQKIK